MKPRTTALVSILLTLCMAQAISQEYSLRDLHQVKKGLRENTRQDQDHQALPLRAVNSVGLHATVDMGETPDLNWSGQFGGSAFDSASDIISDDQGNVYMTGTFSGEIEVQSKLLTGVGESDVIVARFDDSGNLTWITQLSPAEGENIEPGGLCLDDEGNLHLTGAFTGDVQIGTTSLVSQGAESLFFAKLSNTGDVLMASGHESTSEREMGLQIEADPDGNIYILGTALNTDGQNRSIILKFDPSGALFWEQEHDEQFHGMAVNGNAICLSGEYYSWEHDGILDDDVVLPLSDYQETLVAKADLNGDYQWASLSGHVDDPYSWSDSEGQTIGIDENGGIYITGTFRNSVIFGNDTLFDNGWEGGYIAKCNSSGEFLWATKLPHPQVNDHFTEMNGANHIVFPGLITKVDPAGSILWTQEVLQNPEAVTANPSGKLLTTGADMGLIFLSQLDQMASREWFVQFEGNSGLTQILGMVADNQGNLYTYASTENNIVFFGETVQGGIFICKQNGSGEVIWLNQYPGAQIKTNTMGDQIYLDTLNLNIYITGELLDTLDIPGQALHIPEEEGSIVLMKFDLKGNFKWSLQENFNRHSAIAGAVTADQSGNVIISGTFEDTAAIGDQKLVSAGDADCYMAKYSANGDFLWAIRAGGETVEYFAIVSTDAQDNIYFAGEFHSVESTVDQTVLYLEEGDGNIVFGKLNPAGEVQWLKPLAVTGHEWLDDICWPTGIKASNDGSVYMKGSMNDTAYFDQILLTSPYDGFNKFILKADSEGDMIWANCLIQHNTGRRLDYWFDYNQFDIDAEGSVYFGGQVSDTMDFGEGIRFIPASATDLYVAKYSSDGIVEWVKGIKGNETDEGLSLQSVAVYGTGNIFVGAVFDGSLTVDDETLKSPITHGLIAMFGPDIAGPTNVYERQRARIDIYPNPSRGMIVLTSDDDLQGRYVDVISETGQVVHSEIIRSGNQQIDLSYLNGGLYLVWIRDTKYATAKKLIIGP